MSFKSIYTLVMILLFFITVNSYAEEKDYGDLLNNLNREKSELQLIYTAEKISALDKKSIKGKTYASRLRMVYAGIDEAKKLLGNHRIYFSDSLKDKKRIVFLDPGHGGKDVGATVPPIVGQEQETYFLTESSITFRIAQRVKSLLENYGYGVILTRPNEEDGLSLYARSALCRASKADISVSIHLNSSQYAFPIFERMDTAMPELNYSRVFVWGPEPYDFFYPFYNQIHAQIKESGSRQKTLALANSLAEALYAATNVSHELPEEQLAKLDSVKKLRADLAMQKIPSETTEIPLYDIVPGILEKNNKISAMYKEDIKNLPGVNGKDLHMVREIPCIPAVLIEPVFLSAPEEQEKIISNNRIEEISLGIAAGIINYFTSEED
ncbi:N-acetylmuramoyl-L-alanine amidase [bacterium]|nr:N-acetylmuramoyl-L-alanine amidase [bacterium]